MKVNIKKILSIFSVFLCLFVITTCSMILYIKNNNSNSYYLNMNIENMDNNESIPIDYGKIISDVREKYNNDDVKGILEIENTAYIVPVMQSNDNDYYLNHDAYGNNNYMGSIYLDYRVSIDSSRKLLIYGHNSSNIDMPFKILEEFYDKDYYDNHKYVDLTTEKGKKRYEIFSVYVEVEDFSYMRVNFKDDEEYLNHLLKLKSKSMYDTGVEVTKDDEVLILQTCSTHKDYRNYQRKFLLIILRRV